MSYYEWEFIISNTVAFLVWIAASFFLFREYDKMEERLREADELIRESNARLMYYENM